ncbi:Domain of unknown function (DUF1985 [Striga hermonthica]|uniref:Ubiquitin-like protease family profile domain-containing protein n=1 Tax=Striga hermonthica TaxID=68872 RepID=A0A9N7R579_STRHE|nr:Domain of unknown function (DUF1985 [Striga hermonthica]
MKKPILSPSSDDFQSDTKKPEKPRRTGKLEKQTRVLSEEDSDFECVSQPEDSDSEEDLEDEDSPVEMRAKKRKKITRKERDKANRLKKRRRDNNDVTKPSRDFQNKMTYKEWELLIPHPRDINVKIQNSNDNSKDRSTISEIKKTLTKEQLEIFRRSAFGKFLDLPQCIIQNQLINYILLREVHHSRTDELWFNFGGKFLRFGIEEFAVVTGLKCAERSKKMNIPKISDGLHDKYFEGIDLTRNHIRWQFQKKSWVSDEDAVKLAKLHLLANFLMGSQDALRIERCYVDMIDSAECDDYSWGTDVFEFTLYYLKKSIHTREQMHIFEKAEGAGYLYRCYGLILALQTWFYKVCEPAQGVLSTNLRVHDIPRILKWEVRDSYTRIFMERTFSNLHYSKFKNIIPTESERQILLLNSFFKNKNEFTQNEIPSTDTPRHTNGVDVITRLDTITAELESLKQSFIEFSRRVFAEFEFFKETLLGGSSKEHHTDRGNTSDVCDGNEVPIHSSAEKEMTLQTASAVNDENTGVKSPVRAFRTKSEALMKRAADKPLRLQKASDINVENTIVKSPVRAFRTKSEALMKRAADKPLQKATDVNVENTSVKSPASAYRTKSEDLMKNAAYKFVPEPGTHVPVQNLPQPDLHIASGEDDDDTFSMINTQFLEEIDRTLQEKLNESSKGKEKLNESSKGKEPRGFNYDPHPIYGYAVNGSQPSFDASAPVEENVVKAKESNVVVVYVPKIEAVKPTSNPKEKSKKETCPKKKVRCFRSCPFDVAFDIAVSGKVDMTKYRDWIADGLLRTAPRKVDNGLNYYRKLSKTLPKPFDFNVAVVTDKNWFYNIFEINCFLDSSHMDVIFYYLRKFGLYAKSAPVKFTTTDVLFDQHIKSLYTLYLSRSRDQSLCNVHDMIFDYILGYKIICGLPWANVDHVMFPIHLDINGVGHWILGRLSLDDLKLYIYNSIRTEDCDKIAIETVQAYVEIIPIYLRLIKFSKKGLACNGNFEVVMVDNLPQQLNSDCGVFVASFAEHFISGHEISKEKFDINSQRERYGYLLYKHGLMKHVNECDSDDDSPGSVPDEVRFGFLQ